MSQLGDKKDFTFIWAIENFDMCPQEVNERLESPTFRINTLGGRTFQLWFYPRGWKSDGCISCYAIRKAGKPEYNVTVMSTFTVLMDDETLIKPIQASAKRLDKDENNIVWGIPIFQRRAVLFEQKNNYLPNNTLTLKFDVWRMDYDVNPSQGARSFSALDLMGGYKEYNEMCYFKTNSNKCFSRTRIGVRKCKLLWPIQIFSTFPSSLELIKPVYFTGDDEPSFQLIFFHLPGETGADQTAQLKVQKLSPDDSPAFLKSKITIVNAQENQIYHEEEKDHFLQSSVKEKGFMSSSIIKLSELGEKYYFESTQNILYLRCELAISTKNGCNQLSFRNILTKSNTSFKIVTGSNSIADDLKRAYENDKFCDIKLQSDGQEFSAHKIILSARSRVFRVMFETDMQEKNSGVVDIADLLPDTLARMLDYLYSDQLEDMSPADTVSLYKAADKYEILSLKSKCAIALKSSLTVSSVCDVLQLSDMHRDDELMDSIQDFIHLHRDEVFCSPEWENWTRSNGPLAADIMLKEWKRKVYRI